MGSETWFVDDGDQRWVAKAVAPDGAAQFAGGLAIAERLEQAGAQRFHWVDPDAGHLSLRPWLRPAVTAALKALDASRPGTMTWGLLHADPAPDAFRLNAATGRCGIIDWSYAVCGPLVYDLASAVMYAGGPSRPTTSPGGSPRTT